MNIFITGATGQLGNFAIDYLKQFAPQAHLYGLARTKEAAQRLEARGVSARMGDFADKLSLVNAFAGMERLLFISIPQANLQGNVVAAAKEVGIDFIAYTSINGIDYPKNGLEYNHGQTEALIAESGIKHTFLRNSWYLEMELGSFKAAVETGKYDYLSQGKISYATRQEYAEAAARVIATAAFGEVVELGRDAFTHPDLAHALEAATGKNLKITTVDPEIYQADLAAFSETNFELVMQEYVKNGNNGEDAVTKTDFERVLGHPLVPLADAIKSIL
ncbi:NmrA family NAD(P)-binding protein [Lactiplantibacillus plantarum]|uniref:NmrA family NAD(P)-binding protein n=1 Tax=Lactiplantibacillus plantarum TaxID=1590 RepID=UPI00264F620B|nr:NmrA family NAD(P)-binding protein [Lactiplantibacillus plantarum]MDN7032713.1 isoflavone reductase [Lactiplantibacillus plantarum]